MTFRPPIYAPRRELDPFGISSKSQDFFRGDLLTSTLAPPIVRVAPVTAPKWPPEPPTTARFWSQTLVLTTLRGQDARLVGAQLYDRPPLGPQLPAQSYTQSFFPGLAAKMPPIQGLTGPTWGWIPAAQPDRFWSQNLVLTTLRSQDARLSEAAQYFERPPLGPQQPDRFWSQSLVLNTLRGQDNRLTGTQYFERPPLGPLQPDRFWSYSYNLNLIGQDASLTGKQYSDRPSLLFGPLQPDRFWSYSYNLNLVGQDARLVGTQYLDRPPTGPQQPAQSYVQSLFPGLIVVNFPPSPGLTGPAWGWTPALQPDRFWAQNLVINTLRGQDARLAGTQYLERPPVGPLQPDRFWSYSYNLNLVGQDARLIGAQLTSPPWGWTPAYQPDRTWSYSYNLNLIGQDARLPGQFYTWDLPQVAKQPDRSFVQGMLRFPVAFLNLTTQAWLWVPQAATLIQQQFIFPPLKAWIWQPLAGVMTIFRPGWIWRAARGMGILKGGNIAQPGSPFLGGQARIDTIGNVEGQTGRSPNEC